MGQPEFEHPLLPNFEEFPKDFPGIEDVMVLMEGGDILDGGVVMSGDIQEVLHPSKQSVIDGGTVSMRKHFAAAIMSLWVVWTLISLITFVVTGNTALLLTEPAIMIVPLYKVLGHYF